METKLLVSIPSLSRPEKLEKVIRMLYDTCENRNNFDLQIIINKHQEDMYCSVLDRLRHEKLGFFLDIIEYQEDSWENLYNAQYKAFYNPDKEYYFFIFFSDDMYGLGKNWDKLIVLREKFYEDGLFVLYSNCFNWKRNPITFDRCFIMDDKNISPESCCEDNPVWTKEFGKYFKFLFEDPHNWKYAREVLINRMINLLAQKGYKRFVNGGFYYDGVVCDKFQTMEHFKDYNRFSKEEFKLIEPQINEMANAIKNFKI